MISTFKQWIYCDVNVKIKTCTLRLPPNILGILGPTELQIGMSQPTYAQTRVTQQFSAKSVKK